MSFEERQLKLMDVNNIKGKQKGFWEQHPSNRERQKEGWKRKRRKGRKEQNVLSELCWDEWSESERQQVSPCRTVTVTVEGPPASPPGLTAAAGVILLDCRFAPGLQAQPGSLEAGWVMGVLQGHRRGCCMRCVGVLFWKSSVMHNFHRWTPPPNAPMLAITKCMFPFHPISFLSCLYKMHFPFALWAVLPGCFS